MLPLFKFSDCFNSLDLYDASMFAKGLQPRLDLNVFWRSFVEEHEPIICTVEASRPNTPTISVQVLNPKLRLFTPSLQPIVIRPEYGIMFNALTLAAKIQSERQSPAFRLFYIGNPGIGKTLFLLFALAKCIQAKKPVAISWNCRDLYYFDGLSPPQHHMVDRLDFDTLTLNTILLVDSNRTSQPDPFPLWEAHQLLAMATSSQQNRWKWAEKDYQTYFLPVVLPSVRELEAMMAVAASGLGPNLDLLPLIGLCPRRLAVSNDSFQVATDYLAAATKLASDPSSLSAALRGHTIADAHQAESFHQFFLDIPTPQSAPYNNLPPSNNPEEEEARQRLRYSYSVTHRVGTVWQYRILRKAFEAAEKRDGGALLSALKALPNRLPYAIMFEAVVLRDIERGLVRGHFTHHSQRQTLPSSLILFPSTFPVKSYPDPILPDDHSSYFIHVDDSLPTMDGLIVTSTQVIMLQLTISGRHSASSSGIVRVHDWLVGEEDAGDGGREWIFLFVVPSNKSGESLCRASATLTMAEKAEVDLGVSISLSYLKIDHEDLSDLPLVLDHVNADTGAARRSKRQRTITS